MDQAFSDMESGPFVTVNYDRDFIEITYPFARMRSLAIYTIKTLKLMLQLVFLYFFFDISSKYLYILYKRNS